jgi:hypothetical protein
MQAIEAHFEEVAKERPQACREVVTEETLAQETKRVEIEEALLAMAIIAIMQDRFLERSYALQENYMLSSEQFMHRTT